MPSRAQLNQCLHEWVYIHLGLQHTEVLPEWCHRSGQVEWPLAG